MIQFLPKLADPVGAMGLVPRKSHILHLQYRRLGAEVVVAEPFLSMELVEAVELLKFQKFKNFDQIRKPKRKSKFLIKHKIRLLKFFSAKWMWQKKFVKQKHMRSWRSFAKNENEEFVKFKWKRKRIHEVQIKWKWIREIQIGWKLFHKIQIEWKWIQMISRNYEKFTK